MTWLLGYTRFSRYLGNSLRTSRRKRAKLRQAVHTPPAPTVTRVNSLSTQNNLDVNPACSASTFKPVRSCQIDCETSSSLESDFVKVLVEHGVGRKVSNELFSVLRQHRIGEFPSDFRKAAGTVRDVNVRALAGGSYYHFGLFNGLSRELKCFDLSECSKVLIQFNFDGLPLHKSTRKHFWPVLCRALVKENFTNVFPVGIWFGNGKPNDVNAYLNSLLEDLSVLNGNIVVNGKSLCLSIHCFTCDTPARALVKCVKGHGGYSSCERCCIRGITLDGSRKFFEVNSQLRTDQSFREQQDVNHHNSYSPLCSLQVDMVRDFTLDYMHLVLLGVVRKLVCMWFPSFSNNKKHDFRHEHVIGKLTSKAVNRRAEKCGRFWPIEFQRRPRTFKDVNYFKATEFRNIVCYTYPFIFFNSFRSEEVYKHFLLLVVAMRLLLSVDLAPGLVIYSRRLLVKFVKDARKYYGSSFYVNNSHALIHLADDYERFGQLDRVCSFPFESYMYKLKRFVKRGGNELAQVVKRVKEREAWIQPKQVDNDIVKLSMEHNSGPLCECQEDCKQYLSAEVFGKKIRVNSNDDIVLTSKGYCCVSNIVHEGEHIYVIARKYEQVEDVFEYPCKSNLIGMAKCNKLNMKHFKLHVRDIQKCLKVVTDSFTYVCVLLHDNV